VNEGRGVTGLGKAAEEALLRHSWGGNVRELQNRIRRAVLTCVESEIGQADLDLTGFATPGNAQAVLSSTDAIERKKIEQALLEAEGVVSKVAQRLGLSRQALYRKMDRLGIILERRPRS
jgi:DNA-binding NtrC family response regulator